MLLVPARRALQVAGWSIRAFVGKFVWIVLGCLDTPKNRGDPWKLRDGSLEVEIKFIVHNQFFSWPRGTLYIEVTWICLKTLGLILVVFPIADAHDSALKDCNHDNHRNPKDRSIYVVRCCQCTFFKRTH